MESLKDLFAGADEIGTKYQTTDECNASQAELDAVMADIIREAIARGEYDQEKKIWLV